ncbi:MAG TPA: acetyl-CoA C-acyltransferase [Acidiferrobacterales bacterium]|jgi:acetyl-CoA acetyltransferase family protein
MPDNPPRVAIVAGLRTPFVKAGTVFRRHSPLKLASHAVAGLLDRHQVDPAGIDELVYGIVLCDPRIPNLAREIVFNTPLPAGVRAHTVSNNCITGIHAVTALHDAIVSGRAEAGIAGGVESMSNPAVLFRPRAARRFLDFAMARGLGARLKRALALRPGDFLPAMPQIAEPSTGLSMGEHTELIAKEWKIARAEQDRIAYASHMNAAAAAGRLRDEIHPLDGIDRDLLVRPDASLERLAQLKPVFDRSPAGTLTAGNSSPLTDGASAVLLMSEERARREGREPLAFIRDFEYAAIDPRDGLLMAPAVAVPRLLARAGLRLADMDIVEMHEAFGAQVLANLAAWERGWKEPAIGMVDRARLNPLGGSIAVGHPFSATGGRIVTSLANEMRRRGARYGLISICAAGAMAAAMILER